MNRPVTSLLASLPLVALLAGCGIQHRAERDASLAVAYRPVERVVIETHNGSIELVADTGAEASMVRIDAQLWAEGGDDAEARRRVDAGALHCDVEGGKMRIWCSFPDPEDRWSDGCSYRVRLPAGPALELRSHNGDIACEGFDGAVTVSTHNGGIRVARGAGAASGGPVELESHNGSIELEAPAGSTGTLSLQTHNGRRSVEFGGVAPRSDRESGRTREIVFTEGGPATRIQTHNGSIAVRLR